MSLIANFFKRISFVVRKSFASTFERTTSAAGKKNVSNIIKTNTMI